MIDERQKSEFSGDVSYLNRLNYYFFLAGTASMELNAHSWYHSLQVLFRELSTEMKEEEITKWNKESEKINELIKDNLEEQQNTGMTSISPELYKELHNYELFLRGILKSAGLQNRMKEGAENALG